MRRLFFALLSIALIASVVFVLLPEQPVQKEKRLSGAYKALRLWTESRAYPGRDIPQKAYFNAFEKKKRQSLSKTGSEPDFERAGWRSMGPDNVPGRMIALAVNPQNSQTLYAGSASGGLWRTHEASSGAGWHKIETGFPVLGVMAIAIDPADSNTIYIGSGEVYGYQKSIGGFVIRTTRGSYGGQTWNKALDWTQAQQRGIQDIVINPQNSSSVYAATTEGLVKSTNGGASWNTVLDVPMAQDIIVNPDDTTKVLVSCGNLGSSNSGIYRSLDGGNNFSKVSGIPSFHGKTLIDYFDSGPDTVFASVADSLNGKGLYRSNDFGSNWSLVHNIDVPQYQGFFAHFVAVHPTDEQKLVHAGVQIYASSDGGQSLDQISGPHVDHHNYAKDPNNPNVLYIANDGGVYRSANFGRVYKDIGQGLVTSQFYNGTASAWTDSTLAIGGLQDNNTVIYEGSKNWRRVIGGDGSWAAIHPLYHNIMWGSWQYNNILRSEDGGQNFVTATNGMSSERRAFIAPYVVAGEQPNVLYSGRQGIYRTEDLGNLWQLKASGASFDNNPFLAMDVAANDADVVMGATSPISSRAHVYSSEDGGDSWTDITGILPDRYLMDIAIHPQENQTAYIAIGGYGSGHVYKTTNSGQSWTDITGSLPDVPTLALAIDPLQPQHVYVGNDLGVYMSPDGGDSWYIYSRDLPEAVIAMDLNISNANRKLRLATHGNGFWERPLYHTPDEHYVATFDPLPATIITGSSDLRFSGTLQNPRGSNQQTAALLSVNVYDDQDNLVYAEEKQVCCADPQSSLPWQMDEPFSVDDAGNYQIVFNDGHRDVTLLTSVIEPPTITQTQVSKIYRAYTSLDNPTILPRGDDVQSKVNLPFSVTFDNETYNKVQISTNGWVEFGRGGDGTTYGLSTSSQIGSIGANQNGSLASTSRPTKVLGPWWEDLNTDTGAGAGFVGHQTLGSEPNRAFVIEYNNVRAYFDANQTTTRLSFQVRIHESDSHIEFVYGPVQQGTFGGGDIGAMIGLKDHVGGDYHFYDIAAGGSGLTQSVVTNLSPLSDWPGPDSAYVIYTFPTSLEDEKPQQARRFALGVNYPNPFNPQTTVPFELARAAQVKLELYDVLGRRVATILNRRMEAGTHTALVDGRALSSGVYYYRLTAADFIQSRKMLLVK